MVGGLGLHTHALSVAFDLYSSPYGDWSYLRYFFVLLWYGYNFFVLGDSVVSFKNYRMGRIDSPTLLKAAPAFSLIPPTVELKPTPKLNRRFLNPQFKMFHNDTLGNCTAAACLNTLIMLTAILKYSLDIPEDLAIQLYTETADYNPKDPSTDRGAIETQVLARASQNGIPTKFYRYYPVWGTIDYSNILEMATVVEVFGSCYLGVILRMGDMDVLDNRGRLDTYPNIDMRIDGGHALIIVDYDGLEPTDTVYLATWGTLVEATWAWVIARAMEAHALAFRQLMTSHGRSITGLTWDDMIEKNKQFLTRI